MEATATLGRKSGLHTASGTGTAAEPIAAMQRWIVGLIAVTLVLAAPGVAAELPLRKISRHGVTVTVLPNDVGLESKTWEFVIAFDSHVQGALEKLPRSAVLIGPHGSQEAPIEWDGLPLGPFHRHGKLRFAPIATLPKSIEVRIALQGERKPRVFRWQLK